MERMTLYSAALSMFGAKVEIAALEKDLPVDVVMVPFTQQTGYEPRQPEVLRVNPKRQVPVLLHGAVELYDSTQILEYFEDLKPDPPLWPRDIVARALARQREMWSDEVFFAPVIRLMGLEGRWHEPPALAAIQEIHGHYAELERLLENRTYLAGDYGYADIAFVLAQLFAARKGAPMGSSTPRLLAWRQRVIARPAIHRVMLAFKATLVRFGEARPDFLERLA